MARKKTSSFADPAPDKAYDAAMTVTIDEVDWKVGRITVDDISQTYARIRDNRIRAIQRNSVNARDDLMAQALAYAASLDPTEEDYWNYVNTPPGMIYVLWRCFRRHQPKVTEATVAGLIEKESTLKDMILAESGLTAPVKPSDPDAEGENRPPLATFGANKKEKEATSGQAS